MEIGYLSLPLLSRFRSRHNYHLWV